MRGLSGKTAVVVMGALAAGSATAQSAGPKAVYWVSAETTSGFGVGGGGMGIAAMDAASPQFPGAAPQAAPPVGEAVLGGVLSGIGAAGGRTGAVAGALGGMLGGFGRARRAAAPPAPARQAARPAAPAPRAAGYARRLSLELGSAQRPAGAPDAQHLPPTGLQAGPSLPLVTPVVQPRTPTPESYSSPSGERPRGRMLIYWGCGERAAAPPITVDFAQLGQRQAYLPMVTVNTPTPPSAAKHATFGHWPNERAPVEVPPGGSLVGQHTVRGNYSPEINFALGQGQDFLAPLNLVTAASSGGGTQLSWDAVPGATGYFAQMTGSGGDDTMVFWSSSGVPASFSSLMDYLPPSEVRRLIASRHVLAPSVTRCVVPAEVVRASPTGVVQMIAYGDEVNVSDPPRPGPRTPVNWTAKVRFKSTATAMMGMGS